ncbi:MAG: DUF4430 domain-containing protein [Ruminiclostridium sp.]|nr:DUF4430 domain-containing protein [Ruminiclostridium sp.]
MDKKTKRNIAIAIVFLVVLLVEPFWRPLMAAINGEDATSGSTPAGESITCTVGVSVQPALDNIDLMKEESLALLPESGWMLEPVEMTVSEGTTCLEVLQWACQKAEIPVVTSGEPPFVEAIGGLNNGDGGDVSGWTYTLNGEQLMISAAIQEVQEGDEVVFSFACTWE